MQVLGATSGLRVDCDAIVPDDVAPDLAQGITISLGSGIVSTCYEAIVQPTRRGRCWKYRGRFGDPVDSVKLCQRASDQGQYKLAVRLSPSGDGGSCLLDPAVSVRIAAGTAIGEVRCVRDESTGACLVPSVTDEQCENPSDSRDCGTAARIDCNGSYNCEQPTKRCDPRPRTARRDNPNLMCFPATLGAPIMDSAGNLLGNLTESRVRLNYGVHRWFGEDEKVMAFSVETDRGTRTGWISTTKLRSGSVPRDFLSVPALPSAPGPSSARLLVADNWPDDDRNLVTDKAWCAPGVEIGRAWHYLSRTYGTVNLVWSTPGLGSPTAEIYPLNGGHKFRTTNVAPVPVRLYRCPGGEYVKDLRFLYGSVDPGRFGWIAEPNLDPVEIEPDPPPPGPLGCAIGCCSGVQDLTAQAGSEQECRNMAAQKCGASPVRNLFFGHQHLIRSDCLCCAKCTGFTRYHIIDGVKWGQCTAESKALCRRHKRSFSDAKWDDRSGSTGFCR